MRTLFRRRPKTKPGDDVVQRARTRLEDDQRRRQQVEEDLRVITRRASGA
jgi:hypothetical protein